MLKKMRLKNIGYFMFIIKNDRNIYSQIHLYYYYLEITISSLFLGLNILNSC